MTRKKEFRMRQINRLLQEEIADLLLTELQDERLHRLTITEVRTSPDLYHAIVFAATRGAKNREACIEAVRRSAGRIRKLLYSRLHLKRIPELDFRYDESLDRAERIFRTLESLHAEEKDEES